MVQGPRNESASFRAARSAVFACLLSFALLAVMAPAAFADPPDTFIISAQPQESPSNSTSAAFDFIGLPGEPTMTFECELDGDGSFSGPETESCNSKSIAYNALAEGPHVFRVRAIGADGPDATPDEHTWTIDTTAPETMIVSTPPEPSSGVSAAFTYASDESDSTFRCRLDDGAIVDCPAAGQTYSNLLDGVHTFRVWATDKAGNQDSSPDTHSFTVNTALTDLTAPDTTILLSPAKQSTKDSAFFAYTSNEAPVSFQCNLDGAPFTACPDLGIGYANLRNGPHTFAVRAVDRAGNVDGSPATYTWRVAAPLPDSRFTSAPPKRIPLKSKKPARVVFRFASSKPGSTFRCRLDKGPLRRCGSPRRIKARAGRHRFEVYAVDSAGNLELTPAIRIFRVLAGHRGKSK